MALRRRVRPDAESDSVSDLTLDSLKQALGDAGFEIYRIDGDDIRVAERVRMHLMESGVVVCCDDTPHVALTVRGQRSDFPSINESELFDRVRDTFAPQMSERGFEERSASTREINNPADDSQLLDVWFEITFVRAASDASSVVDDVRWALSVSKCIGP